MIFHQIATEQGCQSYLIGCHVHHCALVVDPEISQVDNYLALAAQEGLRIHYLLDTHTHADHFSASKLLSERLHVPVIMHRSSRAPFVTLQVDDGEVIRLGELRLQVIHTPGHTSDSICLKAEDCLLTGDTLLIGGTGRTDLPTGDPEQLYHSLFDRILTLPPETRVYPAHDYKGQRSSTIAAERAANPRLQHECCETFVAQMRALDLKMPTHLTEALRTNLSGAVTVSRLLEEAAERVSFMALDEVKRRLDSGTADFILLDVRERNAYEQGHLPGAVHLPRGQLELRVNQLLPDPTRRIVVYCEFGKISTLATATLRQLGFARAVALDGGALAWCDQGYPLETASAESG
jgi:glyoxylase-like metal-dependent hydrolase (beta-lactamase superfamily II)/rhodanese-related sulfurtransferase